MWYKLDYRQYRTLAVNWSLRYAGNVDHAKMGPHPTKGPCSACLHFDELVETLGKTAEGETISPQRKADIDRVKGMQKLHIDVSKNPT